MQTPNQSENHSLSEKLSLLQKTYHPKRKKQIAHLLQTETSHSNISNQDSTHNHLFCVNHPKIRTEYVCHEPNCESTFFCERCRNQHGQSCPNKKPLELYELLNPDDKPHFEPHIKFVSKSFKRKCSKIFNYCNSKINSWHLQVEKFVDLFQESYTDVNIFYHFKENYDRVLQSYNGKKNFTLFLIIAWFL